MAPHSAPCPVDVLLHVALQAFLPGENPLAFVRYALEQGADSNCALLLPGEVEGTDAPKTPLERLWKGWVDGVIAAQDRLPVWHALREAGARDLGALSDNPWWDAWFAGIVQWHEGVHGSVDSTALALFKDLVLLLEEVGHPAAKAPLAPPHVLEATTLSPGATLMDAVVERREPLLAYSLLQVGASGDDWTCLHRQMPTVFRPWEPEQIALAHACSQRLGAEGLMREVPLASPNGTFQWSLIADWFRRVDSQIYFAEEDDLTSKPRWRHKSFEMQFQHYLGLLERWDALGFDWSRPCTALSRRSPLQVIAEWSQDGRWWMAAGTFLETLWLRQGLNQTLPPAIAPLEARARL